MDFSTLEELYHHLRRRCEHYENINDVQKTLSIQFSSRIRSYLCHSCRGQRLPYMPLLLHPSTQPLHHPEKCLHTNRHDAFEKTLVRRLRPHKLSYGSPSSSWQVSDVLAVIAVVTIPGLLVDFEAQYKL